MKYKNSNQLKFNHFFFFGAFILLLGLLFPPSLHSRELGELREIWTAKRYEEVLPFLLQYRDEPYGRNLEVDYMIATSACRTEECKTDGYKFFRWILAHYRLYERDRNTIINEMGKCGSIEQPAYIDFADLWSTWGVGGVKGKIYYWVDGDYETPIASEPVKIVRNISLDSLRERLFEPSQKDIAVKYIENLVGSNFKVDSVDRFILASSSNHTQQELRYIGRDLETYLNFFAREYKIAIPEHLITVYLVPSIESLRNLAKKIHGIKVSESSIGYSFRDDLSIVAVVPGMKYGTAMHELFHLVVRNNFGDIQPWMDEGMAALYEVSKIYGNYIAGLPNWRGRVLQDFRELRPKIGELIMMDWRSFDNAEEEYRPERQAANHAMARYFVLYLQEKRKLVEVYNVFRNRKVKEMREDPGKDAISLIESALGKSLSEVEVDFEQWFDSIPD